MAKLTQGLRERYRDLFETCTVRPERTAEVEGLVDKLAANRPRYQRVSDATSVPWQVIAVIHNMEASQNFNCHLHNGDPLTARTRQVPPGRPKTGNPPFTWEESATDALTFDRMAQWTDWTVAGTLYKLETYNGSGYLDHHPDVNSPYLWSFSNQYDRGKYAADGRWDPNLRSKQCGAALLLRRMIEKGLFGFTDEPLPPADAPPLVVRYSATKPTDPTVIAQATALQNWLNTHPGIFLRPDGWAGKGTSDAFKLVTGHLLPGDPRG